MNEFRTLRGIDESELLRAFNESVSNYFVRLQLTLRLYRDAVSFPLFKN